MEKLTNDNSEFWNYFGIKIPINIKNVPSIPADSITPRTILSSSTFAAPLSRDSNDRPDRGSRSVYTRMLPGRPRTAVLGRWC